MKLPHSCRLDRRPGRSPGRSGETWAGEPAPFRDKLPQMNHFPEHREPIRDPEVLKRMELAFDLYRVAEEMKRQNLRRQNPDANEEEIEEGIREWLRRRPGAEHGDGVGRPRPKPLEL